MRIGFIGLGKLGLPVALAIESQGFDVIGYDSSPDVQAAIRARQWPHVEQDVPELLAKTNLELADSVDAVVQKADLVFLPVQTPHETRFEGATPLPADRADFDYAALKSAVAEVALCAGLQRKRTTLAVISTCLPGTFKREIRPLLNEWVEYTYTPQFIAMGQVVADYLGPEFALIGVEPEAATAAQKLSNFYQDLLGSDIPQVVTDVTTAEGVKVSYNTWVTAKTVIANLWGELSERLGMDFAAIHKAWSVSTNRLISTKYMQAGMGDGGGCHPRDNIALSHIARREGLSFDFFSALMEAREAHERWHAELARDTVARWDLPLVVIGRAFKPGTQIETGSPALLMACLLRGMGVDFEHWADYSEAIARPPFTAVYFIATQEDEMRRYPFAPGSVVIDPFGFIPDQRAVEVWRLGRPSS